MIEPQDIRWIQRLDNYDRALTVLTNAVELATTKELSPLEKQGLIQSFEFTYELAWNCIKDFYVYLGDTDNIQGSRDAFRLAGKRQLLPMDDVTILMETIKSRQQTSHSYNEETAEEIYQLITQKYSRVFKALSLRLNIEKSERFP
jgi:nucleotidyltransferase substrate binding protein (TIGR01987 family)